MFPRHSRWAWSDCIIQPFWFLAILFLSAISTACGSLPKDYLRTESTAIGAYRNTGLGRLFEEAEKRNPGISGFSIIRYGRQAFTSRIAMADLAEKSLDLQYYIWEEDATGRILAERLLRAADRGVRVRVLVDDINLSGRDAVLAALDAHPHIEIRIFNPFAHRGARIFDFVTDLGRVNHRMHNKIIVADNAVAIVGGRNIGNHYFGVDTEANFRDLDVAAAGPLVRDVSGVFDHFWNGEWAVPISVLVDQPPVQEDLEKAAKQLRERIARDQYPYPLNQDVGRLRSELASIRDVFVWAPGRIVWDDPAAIEEGFAEGNIIKDIFARFDAAQNEILIESAYFVPLDPGVERAKQLVGRGVKIRVLTNSLASNDVVAAHAGWAKRRDDLIASGVEVYELRPDAGAIEKRLISNESKAALHTKAMVLDRKAVYIGSFNLDPRSASINTEAAIYVESPDLAERVIAFMDEGVLPENSYRVLLDEDGDLLWFTETDGEEVLYHKEPLTSLWTRFKAGIIRLLPVEKQL